MRMSEGVEWALHCCVDLSILEPTQTVPVNRLATLYDLPPAYLNKQLQALGRAGILRSTPGPRGGFRLARPLEEITLLDVVVAIEGTQPAFRCTNIIRRGPVAESDAEYGHLMPCAVSQAMRVAELAWRRHLAARVVADVRAVAELRAPRRSTMVREWLVGKGNHRERKRRPCGDRG